LHAFAYGVISPGDFGFLLTSIALAAVKVGGERSIAGPILGAILLGVIGSYAIGLGTAELFFYGGAIILGVLFLPEGIIGLWEKVRPEIGKWVSAPRKKFSLRD
jgi:branched-chain amino acid transport system permease protein